MTRLDFVIAVLDGRVGWPIREERSMKIGEKMRDYCGIGQRIVTIGPDPSA